MKLSTLRVAVVGGAIGGASAALLLARGGARVTLIERHADTRGVGAGIAVAENGLAVLRVLGLAEVLESKSCVVRGARLVDGAERTLFDPRAASSAARLLMVRRGDLYALLHEAVRREPRIDARYGTELEGCSGRALRLLRGGQREQLEADLIVGADGVHSRVRASGDFGARVEESPICYLRALGPEGVAQGAEAWTSAGLFGSFAVPGATYFYASLGTKALRAAIQARDLTALQRAWAEAYPPSRALLGAISSFDQLLVNRVLRVRCTRFFEGTTVLLGDAAHAMAPNLGQGANSALLDGAVLLDELARAEELTSALAAYDARRRPKVEQVATTAARLGRLAELTNPVARWLRDRALTLLAARGDASRAERLVLQEDPSELARSIAGRLAQA